MSLPRHERSYATTAVAPLADVEMIPRPDLRIIDDFVLYWDAKRAGRVAPRLEDIDPSELAAHLPNTFAVDVLDGGAEFRYRAVGKRLVESVGRDVTGRRFGDLYRHQPEVLAQMTSVFNFVVAQRHPVYIRGRIFWLPRRDYRKFTAAFMPLSEDGFSVSAIFAELFVASPRAVPSR